MAGREYGAVSPRFWTSSTGRKLRGKPDAQLVAIYLVTCQTSTMFGLYPIALETIAHEVGIGIERVEAAIAVLQDSAIDFVRYDPDAELAWVVKMATFQMAERLNPGDKRIKGLRKALIALGSHYFASQFWEFYGEKFSLGASPFEAPCKPLRSPLQAPPKGLQTGQ